MVWNRPQTPEARGENADDCRDTWYKNIGPALFEPKGPTFTDQVMYDFIESVRTKTAMKVTIEDGYRAAEIADAIEISYTQGRKIELPLEFK